MKFELEETIWAMNTTKTISKSLEPIVDIIEYKDSVNIYGNLKLMIVGHTEGKNIAKIQHHFPVSITIPKSRINSINDLKLSVDSFSYKYVDDKKILVLADITILGVKDSLYTDSKY